MLKKALFVVACMSIIYISGCAATSMVTPVKRQSANTQSQTSEGGDERNLHPR